MNIPRRTLFGKLNADLFRALESATALAKLRGNPYVEVVHWLHQLWQVPSGDFHRLAAHYGFDIGQVERDLTVALAHLPTGTTGINDFGHLVELAIERAWLFASLTMRDQRVRGAWLLGAMLQTPELRSTLLGISPTFQRISATQMEEDFALAIRGSVEDHAKAHESTDWPPALPGEACGAIGPEAPDQSALAKYCADLTALAREGGIDPVVGREQEIRALVDVLLRRRQNNPLLTGEAGVGKTAVVEGLALAVVSSHVPPSLAQVRILSLDVGALLAGASMRGEFESRIKAVLREAADSTVPVILFVDEVHTLIGAGGQAGTGDAANLLKPALARGAFRVIGATTWSEYKRHIEKDPALTRRFQMLQVLEPQESAAVAMVRSLAPAFAKHHGVTVLDEAVRAAVSLSHRYIPARQLPDKAISLLDTACARVALSQHAPSREVETLQARRDALQVEHALVLHEARIGKDRRDALLEVRQRLADAEHEHKVLADAGAVERSLTTGILEKREACLRIEDESARHVLACELQALEGDLHQLQGDRPGARTEVDEGVVASIVADWTGIPVGRMVRDDLTAVITLEDQLRKRVIGQDAALSTVAARVKTARAGLGDPSKPLGVFLLVGPSGVGKTETALALAQAVYGGEHNLITINMSEYQEAHTVSGLKGSPPGYVGYGEGGVLTEAVRRRPYSVVLLDEVEKAHSDVHELFYQVFDKGCMEDGEGRSIDFRNTLILLTSNTGSDLTHQLCEDPVLVPDTQALMDALQPELRKVFPVAFLGRLLVVPYLPLSADLLESIARLQLQKVVARMQEQHGILLEFTFAALAHVVAQCGTHETGARRIGQFIEHNVLSQLAEVWLQSMHDHVSVRHIVLQTEGEAPARTPNPLTPLPRGGLCMEISWHE